MSRWDVLPFERGQTWGGDQVTLTDSMGKNLLGKVYCAKDTVHGTGADVWLRVVKNDSGSAITVTRSLFKFGTDALDFGLRVDGVTSVQGQVCKPIDDAFTVSDTVPSDDLFYLVESGPCYILPHTSDTSLAVHARVTCGTDGRLDASAADDEDYIVGILDQALTVTTQTVVHVVGGLANEGS